VVSHISRKTSEMWGTFFSWVLQELECNHTVHFVPVTGGKDMGKEVEILNGLRGSEPLVSSPSDPLNEGDHVEVR
jgi:hypothetical protein